MDALGAVAAVAGGLNPFTALTALLPLLTHFGKAAINRWVAPQEFKPATVDEYLAVKKADLNLFSAINGADGNQVTYPWVSAVKQLQRPVVADVVILLWAASHIFNFNSDAINNFAMAIGFYLFADRTLFHIEQPNVKK